MLETEVWMDSDTLEVSGGHFIGIGPRGEIVGVKMPMLTSTRSDESLAIDEPAGPRPIFASIGKRASIVFIPDFSPIVKIPLKRGPIGKTTYNLALDRGVLISQSI